MNLANRIYECRKKTGLSQQELADRLNVSRQAVSKWETGESAPEAAKLLELSRVFSVTVDYLLSDDPPQEPQMPPEPQPAPAAAPAWMEHLPATLQRLFRRYGWLLGVYTAVAGAAFTLMGLLARAMSSGMTRSMNEMMQFMPGSQVEWLDGTGNVISSSVAQQGGLELFESAPGGFSSWMGDSFASVSAAMTSPFDTMANAIMIFGVLLMVAGVIAAVLLRKYGREG